MVTMGKWDSLSTNERREFRRKFREYIADFTTAVVIPAGMVECPECHAARQIMNDFGLYVVCRTCDGQGWVKP